MNGTGCGSDRRISHGYRRNVKTARFLLVIGSLLVSVAARAWNDTGHMVVASIAWQKLKPSARKEIERLLAIGGTPRTRSFLTAACWADDTRTRETGPWHYIDLHFRTDSRPTANQPDAENAAWAIRKFSAVLGDRTKADSERADALRYLEHFVGDIHQPLHDAARDTDEHPGGDKGGNLFAILAPPAFSGAAYRPKNLHALWDTGCGLLIPHYRRPLSGNDERAINALGAAIVKSAGAISSSGDDPLTWAKEGLALCKSTVYDLEEGSVPDETYLARGASVSAKRLVQAADRLARLLNRALG